MTIKNVSPELEALDLAMLEAVQGGATKPVQFEGGGGEASSCSGCCGEGDCGPGDGDGDGGSDGDGGGDGGDGGDGGGDGG
jgi:hypothetical protein